ncbi:protein-disulfide reductase DsbD [Alkalilimnicola ehrlichii]|uniref:protein-disulfide reductase DsbD n=1 Tax=Alkalilimnicola ehrlichii TaxID=351052 RepID=UPI000E2E8096|nr:protein-disulfide reductase DsbD [Alkalilimnicola ehrlichii]
MINFLQRAWLPGLLLALAIAFVSAPAQANSGGIFGFFSGGNSNEPLPAEQAFPFSAERAGAQTIVARWDTKDGYYLYRDKLDFSLKGTDAEIVEIELSPGELKDDPYFGEQKVLFGTAEARLTLSEPVSGDFTLTAYYQGCAQAGLCYPPLSIDYPFGSAPPEAPTPTVNPAPTDAGAIPPPNDTDRLAGLLEGGNLALILGAFFVAGLLLAFTACLYPMIPILSGLIAGDRGEKSSKRAFLLSFVYVQATAVTYAIAGALAGLSGQAIQADMQSPWILGSFAAVFVLLALSMFGLYDLQLPASWQTRLNQLSNKQRGGNLIGVAIMGMLSALIVGACSGPALIAALVFISNTGDAWLGGLALYVMANGMGIPLLIIGTAAGKWLPRSGPWMVTVKKIFGVGFLAVALWMIERILPGSVGLALWGALLLGCAVYLGAFDSLTAEADGTQRLRKFGGLLLFLWGSLVLIGAAAGNRDFWQRYTGSALRRQARSRSYAFSRLKP